MEEKVKIGFGSSSHHPERKEGMRTNNVVLWVKYKDEWFMPNIRGAHIIREMVAACGDDDNKLDELISSLRDDLR